MSELEIYKGMVKKMKDDEIEEILSLLNSSSWSNEAKQIEDYITNLQQQIEKLNEDKRGMLVELYKANDKRDKLQEENERLKQADKNTYETSQEIMAELTRENERLKERISYLERSNNRREDTIMSLRDEINSYEDYKSRCEKAVEYINYYGTTPEENDDTTCRHILKSLLNILNGKE